MQLTVNRTLSAHATLYVELDAADHAIAFPCGSADAELYFALHRDCDRSPREELAIFARVLAVLEAAQVTLNLSGSDPEPK